MKLSETDGAFWDLIGILNHCDGQIYQWSYNKDKNMITLRAPGETTTLTLDDLNKCLNDEKDFIRSRWKTGNHFDGKLEVD